MNNLTCYICHKSTFVAIPEEQGSEKLVPACNKCYYDYSSNGFLLENITKQEMYKKVIEDISYELKDIRSELTSGNPDKDWCIDKICDLLNTLNKNDSSIKS